MRKQLLFLWFAFFPGIGMDILHAGTSGTDSLRKVIEHSREDSNRVLAQIELSRELYLNGDNTGSMRVAVEARQTSAHIGFHDGMALAYNQIGNAYQAQGDYAHAFQNHIYALQIRTKSGDKIGMGSSYNNLGNIYLAQGNFAAAHDYYQKALKLFEATNYLKGLANCYTCIGSAYQLQGNLAKALEEHFKALKIQENLKDKHGICAVLNNIGATYASSGDYDKALEYHFRSLHTSEEIGYRENVSLALNNIGYIYASLKNASQAIVYCNKSLHICQELNDKKGIANNYSLLGDVSMSIRDYSTALKFYYKALRIQEELEDNDGVSTTYKNMGLAEDAEGNYAMAWENCQKALDLGKRIGSLEDIANANQALSRISEHLHDSPNAFDYYKAYISAKDSLFNTENTKKSVQAEMNFEFEKKQAIEKAIEEKKAALAAADKHRQQIILSSASGLLILLCGFSLFVVRNYRQKQKANEELDLRNKKIGAAYRIIEEKNLEITDSINYALKIQQAILPSPEELQKSIPGSFIFFRPKDIVSGDFYWLSSPASTHLFLAAADCTGHGVPGAFMSMIGSEKLNEAVRQARDPGTILTLLNKGVRNSLHQEGREASSRDGMDIALLSLEVLDGIPTGKIEYAGANRPLWLIRNGNNQIEELKPTKASIGGFTENDQVFTNHRLELQPGDTCYMFSDGFADQFGGESGKKLTSRKFKELLLNLQDRDMGEQQSALDDFFRNWKSDKEQVDDILVIGIRI